ncbi:hypothetical protein ACC754_37115, partial [Rhizobium johnstonii]
MLSIRNVSELYSKFTDEFHINDTIIISILEGGTVLLSVMDVLNRLLNSLESVTTTLDNKEASDTIADLRATVESLMALPVTEENRQQALVSLAHTGRELRKHVADMKETMRYLRT